MGETMAETLGWGDNWQVESRNSLTEIKPLLCWCSGLWCADTGHSSPAAPFPLSYSPPHLCDGLLLPVLFRSLATGQLLGKSVPALSCGWLGFQWIIWQSQLRKKSWVCVSDSSLRAACAGMGKCSKEPCFVHVAAGPAPVQTWHRRHPCQDLDFKLTESQLCFWFMTLLAGEVLGTSTWHTCQVTFHLVQRFSYKRQIKLKKLKIKKIKICESRKVWKTMRCKGTREEWAGSNCTDKSASVLKEKEQRLRQKNLWILLDPCGESHNQCPQGPAGSSRRTISHGFIDCFSSLSFIIFPV